MPDKSSDKWGLKRLLSSLLRQDSTPAAESDSSVHERYRLLTENLAAAVLLRDGDGKIIYCSPYVEVLTGYPIAAILSHDGDFFYSIVHEKDREQYARAIKVALCGEPFQFRYRFYHKSGLEMWAETRSVPVDDSSEERCPTLSITLDVTGNVLYQKQVEERNRDLRDFTYMITHDLKAPVFTIKGMIGVLEEDVVPQPGTEQGDAFQHIKKAIGRLEELIGGVLEYSKISAEATALEPVDLNIVIKEALGDLSGLVESTHAEIAVADNLPAAVGERMRLYRIFSNLIGNALKYTPSGRTPRVRLFEAECRSPRKCVIGVEDNGSGIPADKLDLIFRPFQRVNPGNVEGTGIGLASVKRLLEKLGGEIEVESEEGRGSTFFVTLKRV